MGLPKYIKLKPFSYFCQDNEDAFVNSHFSTSFHEQAEAATCILGKCVSSSKVCLVFLFSSLVSPSRMKVLRGNEMASPHPLL